MEFVHCMLTIAGLLLIYTRKIEQLVIQYHSTRNYEYAHTLIMDLGDCVVNTPKKEHYYKVKDHIDIAGVYYKNANTALVAIQPNNQDNQPRQPVKLTAVK